MFILGYVTLGNFSSNLYRNKICNGVFMHAVRISCKCACCMYAVNVVNYSSTLNFEQKLPQKAQCADRCQLRRDTITSREHLISPATYHTIVPSTEELYCLNSARAVINFFQFTKSAK